MRDMSPEFSNLDEILKVGTPLIYVNINENKLIGRYVIAQVYPVFYHDVDKEGNIIHAETVIASLGAYKNDQVIIFEGFTDCLIWVREQQGYDLFMVRPSCIDMFNMELLQRIGIPLVPNEATVFVPVKKVLQVCFVKNPLTRTTDVHQYL